VTRSNNRRTTAKLAALAVLASGTLFSACSSRLKDATVSGATGYLFTLLDPATVLAALAGSTADSTTAGGV